MAESSSASTPQPMKPRRRGRRVLLLLAGLVLLLLVLVLLAPTLISLGLGQGLIRNAAASSVNGTLDIKSMSLGWFSGQKIEGVRIVDASGKEAANLSIAVNNSLLSLATGGAGSSTPFDVTISGSVAGQLREDGSISFTELLKEDPAKAKSPKPPPTPSTKPKKPLRDAIPRAIVNIAGLNVTLDDLKNKQSLKIDDLKGKFAYVDPEQPITFDLHGKTNTNIAGKFGAGSIDITGQADHVFAQDGSITLRGAAAKLDVKATGLPLPLQVQERNATLQTFAMNIASDDLTDRIAITMSSEAQIEGAAPTATPTNIKLDGSIGKALDGDGKLSLRAANAQFTGELTNVPVSSNGETGIQGEMSTLALTILSDDLTKKIEVAATGEGMINGNQPSALSANLALADPFTPAGGFQFALDKLTGSASGTRVPTSLAQPMLAGLGIDAARDLGPTVDVEAFFPGGVGGDLMVSATAANAKAEVAAKSNADGSITGSKLALQLPHADPALIAALTNNAVFSDRPLNVKIDLASFTVPAPAGVKQPRPLGQFAAKGALSVSGPAGVRAEGAETGNGTTATTAPAPATAPAKPPLVPLERIDLKFDTPALAQHVTLVGNARVGGGSIVIDERITNLFDTHGVLAAAKARPEGSIKIDNLPVETILAFAPPEHADLITQIIGREMFAELRTTPMDAGLKTEVAARTNAATIDINMVGRADGSLQLDEALIDVTITPELAAVAQRSSVNPVVLGGPAKINIDLKPILLPGGAVADVLSSPFSGKVALTDANIAKAPGLADALIIPSLTADLTVQMRGDDINATITDGQATLKRGAGKADIATLAIAGTYVSKDGVTSPNLDVNFADLHTREAEALLGMTPGTIANWTGDRGGLDVHVETEAAGYSATAKSNMPNVQGTFTAAMKDELVSITAETSKLVLGKNALQARLNPPPPVDGSAPDAKAATAVKDTLITVDADVPVQLAISRLEFPMKMLNREAFDAGLVNMDIALTGGPLKTTTKDGVRSTLTDLRMSLKAADISKGVQFALKGDAESIMPAPPAPPPPPLQQPKPATPAPANAATATPPAKSLEEMTPDERRDARREERRQERTATSQPSAPAVESKPPPPPTPSPTTAPSEPVRMVGQLNVTGSMLDVVNSAGVLDMAGSRLQMNANAANVPTAVADALADMQGLLVAAVGPQMNADFVADDFSANTGTLNAKINTTHGSLTAVLRGKDNSLRVNKNAPVMAELEITPPLRERLLLKIHPILADVRTTEQPLRVEIPTALAAIPADVSKLRAEINITVGKVELDSGSTTLKLLSFIGAGDRGTIPGEIEPIRAQIRNGIVTYDKFSVHIDKYTLNYSGQIDLVKDEVNLRTEIPLKALNDQFPQLRDYAESIVVPLVTRGKFGALKTTIDPDFDIAKAALNAGFKGTLGNILGGDAGGLLDGLLNKDKDKKNEGGAIANPPERPRRRDRPTTQPQG